LSLVFLFLIIIIELFNAYNKIILVQ